MPQKYSPEFKAKALQLIEERIRAEQCSLRSGRLRGRGRSPRRDLTPHPAELVEAKPRRPRRDPRCEH